MKLAIHAYRCTVSARTFSFGVTLATNNVREFERVAGLQVERWA